MTIPTQPLRDEHQELLPQIALLKTVADAIGRAPNASVQQEIENACRFLREHLLIHAQAEEAVLYPLVGKLMGAPEATATMRRDHVALRQLSEELHTLYHAGLEHEPGAEQEQELRRVLYGLFALLMVHFAKEEEIYLPLLDAQLTATEARTLFSAMEEAAHQARTLGAR